MMSEPLVIPRRFRGPATSANGGYVGGLLARALGGAAEVTLRRPPPFEAPLRVEPIADGVALVHEGIVVAEARPALVPRDTPAPPTVEEAVAAVRDFVGFRRHTFPECFVCGTERPAGDGLRIFPGPIRDGAMVAAAWTPDASVADGLGRVPWEVTWAAMDCPAGYGLVATHDRWLQLRGSIVTGRIAADVIHPVTVGRRYVVGGWPLAEEGRRIFAGAAMWSDSGELHAVAKTIWIRRAPTTRP